MNRWLAAAAFLSAITAGIHIIWGGLEIPPQFWASDMTTDMRAMALILWHFASIILLIATCVLIMAASNRANMGSALAVIAALYAAIMLLFLAYDIGMFGSLLALPQWIAFLLILLCMAMAMRAKSPIVARDS